MIRIHEARDDEPPIDQFKVEHHPQAKHKFNVSEKVNNITHWQFSDKVGDPEIKKGWTPSLTWSDQQAQYLCNGKNRPFRTFEKIYNAERVKNEKDAVREKQVEELIIKQAPRSL